MVFHHFSQDVFFGAKGCDLAAFNHHECIAFLNGRRAMRDDQNRIAFSFEAPHRSVERRDALIVQIGVGFVQNQKHRIAKKGPRQTDALCLAVPLPDCARACGPNANSVAANTVANTAVIRPIMPWNL